MYRAYLVLLFRGQKLRQLRTRAVVPDEQRIFRVAVQQLQYLHCTDSVALQLIWNTYTVVPQHRLANVGRRAFAVHIWWCPNIG